MRSFMFTKKKLTKPEFCFLLVNTSNYFCRCYGESTYHACEHDATLPRGRAVGRR